MLKKIALFLMLFGGLAYAEQREYIQGNSFLIELSDEVVVTGNTYSEVMFENAFSYSSFMFDILSPSGITTANAKWYMQSGDLLVEEVLTEGQPTSGIKANFLLIEIENLTGDDASITGQFVLSGIRELN